MVATIDHPNVCTIYDIGEDPELPYIVMQYVQGETLAERMQRGRLDLTETIGIARQITLALGEAHSRGIVHRDIKPRNIMISSAGVVKVLDFGLAKSFALDAVTEMMVSRGGTGVGNDGVHVARAASRRGTRRAQRHLQPGCRALRDRFRGRSFIARRSASTVTAILTDDPPPLDTPLQPVIARALAKPCRGGTPRLLDCTKPSLR